MRENARKKVILISNDAVIIDKAIYIFEFKFDGNKIQNSILDMTGRDDWDEFLRNLG